MCSLSNKTGSISNSIPSRNDGDFTNSFTGKDYYQDLINKANSVPIINIFKLYGYNLNEYNKKIICPFKFHKGGRESTASFCYYAATNSFKCFGCNAGGRACEFISSLEGIKKIDAAHKILNLFHDDVDLDHINIENQGDFSERLEIMINFSNFIREFRSNNLDEESYIFIEKICEIYDLHNSKRILDNKALQRVVEQLINKINLYRKDNI